MFNINKYNEILQEIAKNGKKTTIIAVSKNHSQESVLEAISFGVTNFGENRVQEAEKKFRAILEAKTNIHLHLTGPLQTNKVKKAIGLFNIFHTLDREKLAIEFSKYSEKLKDKSFYIQVNTGREPNKSGILPNELNDFCEYSLKKLRLNVVGLMCIPPIHEKPEYHFKYLKELGEHNNIKNYSMGMTADYKEAIMLGANLIRIGTALFGKR